MTGNALSEVVTKDNIKDVQKKIQNGVAKSLSVGTLDPAASREVLRQLNTLVKPGISVGQVLENVNKVITDSFRKTGFVEYEPMKIITRMFTQSNYR